MKLLIAIPALNEEESIAQIIERSLAAVDTIRRRAALTEVAITVVSDGSTDRTCERSSPYINRISLIVFEGNRGYGAAIKEAWRQSDAELLAFIDADGTCDPEFFGELCAALIEADADIALGCRMNPESRMPLTRRVGNLIFALLLTAFSARRVRDCASGMRVVRRRCLSRLMPLPDGLQFTPAMSARAVLAEGIRIIERDMPYRERSGRSKLHVLRDGLRFLRVILETALLHRPSRPLGLLGIAAFIPACILMATPILYYLEHRAVEEWMIRRFVLSQLLGTSAILFGSAAYLAARTVAICFAEPLAAARPTGLLRRLFASRAFLLLPAAALCLGIGLVIPGLYKGGANYEHWSRTIAMSSFCGAAIVLLITKAVDYSLDLIEDRLRFLATQREARTDAPP